MDNQDIFNQFLQDVLQVNINHVRLDINGFAESFREIITLTDEDIDTFVINAHSSNSTMESSSRVLIGPRVFTHIKDVRF